MYVCVRSMYVCMMISMYVYMYVHMYVNVSLKSDWTKSVMVSCYLLTFDLAARLQASTSSIRHVVLYWCLIAECCRIRRIIAVLLLSREDPVGLSDCLGPSLTAHRITGAIVLFKSFR